MSHKRYAIYDPEGFILRVVTCLPAHAAMQLGEDGHGYIEAEGGVDDLTHSVDVATQTLVVRPAPEPPRATWADIRRWRDTHETSPVTTTPGTFDADPRSDARMVGAIEEFDRLPTLDVDARLTWKLADNSYLPVTKADLQQVYDELKTNRAKRGALLHVKAEQFNAMDPKPTVAELKDLAFWLT